MVTEKFLKLSECFSVKNNPIIIICNVEDIISITDGLIGRAKKGNKQYKLFDTEIVKGVKSCLFNINGCSFIFIDEKDINKLNIPIINNNVLDVSPWNFFLELVNTTGSGWVFAK